MSLETKIIIDQTPIHFKTKLEFEQWHQLPTHNVAMYDLAYEFAQIHWCNFNKPAVVTSIFRNKKDDSGVHALWRAVDFRTHHLDEGEKTWLTDYFNQHFVFDDDRPQFKVMIIHGKDLNEHAHLQIHQHTYRKYYYYD
jgi:hypothetical protein